MIANCGVEPEDIGAGTLAALEDHIEQLLARASQEIDSYLGRSLTYEEEYTETVDGTGRSTLKLDHYPVHEVHSVEVSGTPLDESEYRANSSGVLERRGRWPEGWGNVEVTYEYGYEDGQHTAAQIAEEMVIPVLERAEIERISEGKDSVSMDGFSVSFDDPEGDFRLIPEHKERLDQLREVAMA
ncbi:hypothetical protein AArcMg_1487 [Natrarchaeobaculum sulfurireducens]|uniref:Uncharacterized protein n=1 Tax=Natrarchaeobaculum sulfurireducens TaxID=2044521 RepID=A0A346PPQ5_9EURY|nr:hypothetical protein AArcMg_1487 [Natrarchaeobaculum sulfurireducens]